MLACNALSSGTGFSREGSISDSKHGVDVLASSRLKRSAARAVPHENASEGAVLARDTAASVHQADRITVDRRNAAQTRLTPTDGYRMHVRIRPRMRCPNNAPHYPTQRISLTYMKCSVLTRWWVIITGVAAGSKDTASMIISA